MINGDAYCLLKKKDLDIQLFENFQLLWAEGMPSMAARYNSFKLCPTLSIYCLLTKIIWEGPANVSLFPYRKICPPYHGSRKDSWSNKTQEYDKATAWLAHIAKVSGNRFSGMIERKIHIPWLKLVIVVEHWSSLCLKQCTPMHIKKMAIYIGWLLKVKVGYLFANASWVLTWWKSPNHKCETPRET